jgi:hypothetical protein
VAGEKIHDCVDELILIDEVDKKGSTNYNLESILFNQMIAS